MAHLTRIQRIVRRLVKAGRWLRVPYGVYKSLLREISEDEIRNALLTGRVIAYDPDRERFVVADTMPARGELRVVGEFGYALLSPRPPQIGAEDEKPPGKEHGGRVPL